jgi:hypothetical protein
MLHVSCETASSQLHLLRRMQLGVVKQPKLGEAPAAQSFSSGIRVYDHPSLGVREKYGVARRL